MAKPNSEEDIKRLLWDEKVDKREDGCWIWLGKIKDRNPAKYNLYGVIGWRGKLVRCHRVSYELAFGPIPPHMVVMHICDTPPCVNPDHLKLGTHSENFHDMWNKLRARPFGAQRRVDFSRTAKIPRRIKLNSLLATAIRVLVK